MIKRIISKLIEKKDLTFQETRGVFLDIFEERLTSSQIAAFLVALRLKGETSQEISAAAGVIMEKAKKIKVRDDFLGIEKDEPIVDTCGTGGSGVNKFNISTATSFVVAASGVKVAKHGNRAVSSTCGSADVFEILGIKINSPCDVMEEAIKKVGIGFLYAPLYHPAFGVVAPIRREVGIRTIFNILGPLCNPAKASHQLLGVFSADYMVKMAKALRDLGVRRAFVVHGRDLGDEISLTGETKVVFLNKKRISQIKLHPSSFGLKKCKLRDLEAKDASASARIIKEVLAGKKGAPLDIVLANASACFYILGRVGSLKDGVKLASQLIHSGKAKKKFLEFKNFLSIRAN